MAIKIPFNWPEEGSRGPGMASQAPVVTWEQTPRIRQLQSGSLPWEHHLPSKVTHSHFDHITCRTWGPIVGGHHQANMNFPELTQETGWGAPGDPSGKDWWRQQKTVRHGQQRGSPGIGVTIFKSRASSQLCVCSLWSLWAATAQLGWEPCSHLPQH